MVAKTLFAVVASLLLIQSIAGQCLSACNGIGSYGAGYAAPCRYAAPASALAASNGPGLAITSASPMSPIGVTVASENVIEGALAVAGALPFLGTVGLEGILPTAGAGNVAYNCGNGAVAITAEDIAAEAYGYGMGPIGYGAGSLGYGAGLLGYGAGSMGYGADLLGCGAGTLGYGAGILGYGAGSLGYGEAIGCGCGLAPSRCPYGFCDGDLGYTYCPYGYGEGPYAGPYGAGLYGAGPYGYAGYGYGSYGCGIL